VKPVCPPGNINPDTMPAYAPPKCTCPSPTMTQSGVNYTQRKVGSKIVWECSPGYTGYVAYECVPTSRAAYKWVFTGCQQVQRCVAPDLDNATACKLDLSECPDGAAAGGACQVNCSAPYTGSGTEATCPELNTNPYREVSWSLNCGLECEEIPLPTGYVRATEEYQCAEGFRGSPYQTCQGTADCSSELLMLGCDPITECAVPRATSLLEQCKLDWGSCQGTEPGAYCELRCKAPFVGSPVQALCRPGNVDPNTPLLFVEPDCILPCSDPVPIPVGYIKLSCAGSANSRLTNSSITLPGWRCAPGYTGEAVASCGVTEPAKRGDSCVRFLELSGCAKIEPCSVPAFEGDEACRFNVSDCIKEGAAEQLMQPGDLCTLRCMSFGGSVTVTCPPNNTVSMGSPVIPPLTCNAVCPDPEVVPFNWRKRPKASAPAGQSLDGDSWACAEGYGGAFSAKCVFDENCTSTSLELTGCDKLQWCLPVPRLEKDKCRLDYSDCSAMLQNGKSCELRCKSPPYPGLSTKATCPSGNTAQSRLPDFVEPKCELECPSHPDGDMAYFYDVTRKTWRCADDAVGNISAKCNLIPSNCTSRLAASGCALLQKCTLPTLSVCQVDGCTQLGPGQTCTAACKAPYSGPTVTGRCPVNNTNASMPAMWSPAPPYCKCPDLTEVPEGYAREGSDWRCSTNYTGTAVARCVVNEKNCLIPGQLVLSGCLLVVPCAPPDPSLLLDRSQCLSVPDGLDCNASCVETDCVSAGIVRLRCPPLNTDPLKRPDRISGLCDVLCEVCSLEEFADMDQGASVSGTVMFGPVHRQGAMDVKGITGYRIFFADECWEEVPGGNSRFVPQRDDAFECCLADAYKVELEAVPMPDRDSYRGSLYLVVALVGVEGIGEFPFGARVLLNDVFRNASAGGVGGARAPTSSGHRSFGMSASSVARLLPLLLAAAAALPRLCAAGGRR